MRPRTVRRPIVFSCGEEWWQDGRWTATPDYRRDFSSHRTCRTMKQARKVALSCPSGATITLPVKRSGKWVELEWVYFRHVPTWSEWARTPGTSEDEKWSNWIAKVNGRRNTPTPEAP